MPASSPTGDAVLEVIFADESRRTERILASTFLIGRGEAGNHLRLADLRVSRQSAAIEFEAGRYTLADRGQQGGIFVNGKQIRSQVLRDGDVITFGPADSCEVIFRLVPSDTPSSRVLDQIAGITSGASATGLNKLNLLLEATMLLRSQLPLESVLGSMLDHAIAVTHADRGLLLEAEAGGSLRGRLARRSGGVTLQPESFTPSQTALRQALQQQSAIITEDLALADVDLQAAQSIVAQRLRAIVVLPLYAVPHGGVLEPEAGTKRGEFLGVVYLVSRRPAAFSKLDRQILDALAAEAASILDNARLVERELQRQLLEQELRIARQIQQALLPGDFREFPHLSVKGFNLPSLTASGDYYDVFPAGPDRTAFLIADVSGKGLGAALLTTILQGALLGITAGADASGIFRSLNRFLCQRSEVDRYATVFLGTLGDRGRLQFINAGHPSPLLLRHGEVSRPFTEGSVPVGLIPEADYVPAELQLQPGDTLVLFSDGVTEAMNRGGEMFGMSRLCEAVSGREAAPGDLQGAILDSVKMFTGGAGQADDITLLVIRYLGNSAGAAS